MISQGLFRLKNNRFEQIGQAWVKHTILAYQMALCSDDCVESRDSQFLGVNCSDPYSGTENGHQPRMGPRSEIDPVTASWPYPFTGFGEIGNVLNKRLQAHDADLDPALNPGATYFVEVQYVARDDIQGGNRDNSISYRPVAIHQEPGIGYYLTFTGPTEVGRPVLEAWEAADPAVEPRCSPPTGS